MTSLKLLLRFAIVGGLVLLLLIPLLLIRSTINERERYRDEAVERVSQSWAGEQSLIGPVRVLPWTQQREVEIPAEGNNPRRTEMRVESGYDLQMPTRLNVQGTMRTDERTVGLFKVPVYNWQAKLQAEFAESSYVAVPGRSYGRPYLALGVSDVRGLVGTPNLRVDGRAIQLQPGSGALEGTSKGLHAPLSVLPDSVQGVLREGGRSSWSSCWVAPVRWRLRRSVMIPGCRCRQPGSIRCSVAASCPTSAASMPAASRRSGRCLRWPRRRSRSWSGRYVAMAAAWSH